MSHGAIRATLDAAPLGSPLERAMLLDWLCGNEADIEVRVGKAAGAGAVWIEPQAPLGRYRVDFLLSYRHTSVAVECDGHDYHERTKAQAARDRQRDRYIQAQGIPIFRFTGSEIWAEPGECAAEALQELIRRAGAR